MGISGSVGHGGQNKPDDVRQVQTLLKSFYDDIETDGVFHPTTLAVIKAYQRVVLGMVPPDGRVLPHGSTYSRLVADSRSARPVAKLEDFWSGDAWCRKFAANFPNSTSVDDLSPAFKPRVVAFLAALDAANVDYSVSTTRRNRNRAYLMHYSWKIAKGELGAGVVPVNPEVKIVWDHGSNADSIAAAKEMVAYFKVVYQPSLNSRHIQGDAIDMDIDWSREIHVKKMDGSMVRIPGPDTGADSDALHAVGRTYGVIKNAKDAPHWSTDGH